MSTYYSFYIGYRDNKTKKICALGPYDFKGELKSIFDRSGSFVSDLHKEFYNVSPENMDDSILKEFTYESYFEDKDGNKKLVSNLYCLDIDDLPSSNFVKSGYFLKEDVAEYLEENSAEDLFYNKIDSPIIYAEMVKDEIMFGKNQDEKDDEGYTIKKYSASDYMFFAYPDYYCKEYESHLIKTAYHTLYHKYDDFWKDKDVTIVALMAID